jgi:hypothetical protein
MISLNIHRLGYERGLETQFGRDLGAGYEHKEQTRPLEVNIPLKIMRVSAG